jgi:hypothetical protein
MICTELSTDNYCCASFHKNMQNQYYNPINPLVEGVILPKIKLDLSQVLHILSQIYPNNPKDNHLSQKTHKEVIKMSNPPAFTACQPNFMNEFIANEISQKTRKKTALLPDSKLKNNLMLRIALPPLCIWAVLFCVVEYLI